MKWPSDEDQKRDGVLRAVVDIAKNLERQRDRYRHTIEIAYTCLGDWCEANASSFVVSVCDILAKALKEEDDA